MKHKYSKKKKKLSKRKVNYKRKTKKNKRFRRSKKAGKAVNRGTFGCVFKPQLLCSGKTERDPNGVSKLLEKIDADEEMVEIKKVQTALASLTKRQKKYFSVFDVETCSVNPITETSDFEGVNTVCGRIIDERNIESFNKNIDKYRLINMPDYGVESGELITNTTKENIILLNNLLKDFVKSAIVPMNKLNVLHNDVKDTNIMYDGKNLVLIDWGFCAIGKNRSSLPLNVVNNYKVIMANTPFSSLLLKTKNRLSSLDFVDWYKAIKTDYTLRNKAVIPSDTPTRDIISLYFELEYAPRFYGDGRNDHTKYLSEFILPNVFMGYSFPDYINSSTLFQSLLTNYISTILESDRFVKDNNFDVVKFYYENYLFNCDIWGICYLFSKLIIDLRKSTIDNKDEIIFAYQDLLWNEVYKNGSLKIDVNGIFDDGGKLDKINDLISGNNQNDPTVFFPKRSKRLAAKNPVLDEKDQDTEITGIDNV